MCGPYKNKNNPENKINNKRNMCCLPLLLRWLIKSKDSGMVNPIEKYRILRIKSNKLLSS